MMKLTITTFNTFMQNEGKIYYKAKRKSIKTQKCFPICCFSLSSKATDYIEFLIVRRTHIQIRNPWKTKKAGSLS